MQQKSRIMGKRNIDGTGQSEKGKGGNGTNCTKQSGIKDKERKEEKKNGRTE